MSRKIVECIPNFSEGRRPEVIQEIVSSILAQGCRILDVSSDPDHNRSVVSFLGTPEQILEAAFASCRTASKLINMEEHTGAHPRIGATDVIPLVPVLGISMDECIKLAEALGERIGKELEIPVYLYARAARVPERVLLPNIRRGEYEGLKVEIAVDPSRTPDFGPRRLHPTAGATAVGARPPLIAFNVNLATSDVTVARRIARQIRESSGGFPAIQAKGILAAEKGLAQVTMNILDWTVTGIETVYSAIEKLASDYGTEVHSSELVGLAPVGALLDVVRARLKLDNLSADKVLEMNLMEE